MSVHIVCASRSPFDVVLLYDNAVVFSESIAGARYVSEQASQGSVPFATLSVPTRLQNASLIPRLSVYYNSYNDIFADQFVVNQQGAVSSASFDDPNPSLPEQNFWRSIAALYRSLDSTLVEW
jgi:hypothetical protein